MTIESNKHHLVLGELSDFLTGKSLADTHDERYRQKIAKQLVLNKGYHRALIQSNQKIHILVKEKKASLRIDFLISLFDKIVVLIKFAPGSIVTRRVSAIALSRIIKPYQIPFVIITNGEDAEIMDGSTGDVLSSGIDNFPDFEMVKKQFSSYQFNKISNTVFNQASRIAYAFEIDGACPCDTDICVINN